KGWTANSMGGRSPARGGARLLRGGFRMRYAVFVFSLSLLVATGGTIGSAAADEFDWTDPRYDWELSDCPADVNEFFAPPDLENYFQADALWLARMHSARQTVAVTLPPASQPVLNSKDATLTDRFRLGTLLTLGRRLDQVSALELTFFGF